MPNTLITPRDVAVFLETCTESEFAEAFILYMKFHKEDSLDEITAEDENAFDIDECVDNIRYSLMDILYITHGLERGA